MNFSISRHRAKSHVATFPFSWSLNPTPETVSFSSGKVKRKIRLTGGNLEQDQAHFTGKILTFPHFKPCFCQVDHTPDASHKLLCQGVRCSLGYQSWSSMQMRTLSSPVCLPLIMTPIKDSRQRGDSAIVIATQTRPLSSHPCCFISKHNTALHPGTQEKAWISGRERSALNLNSILTLLRRQHSDTICNIR